MEPNTTPAPVPEKETSFWKELVKLAVIAVVIIIPFRLYIAQPFVVDGASMDPTFRNGQYLVVDEFSYHFKTPIRGSVLIFRYPKDPKKYFIKRVIGLPNEQVAINNGEVTIINTDNPKGFLLNEPYVKLTKDETETYILKSKEYFVMGDNRAGSADSRLWGPVPEKNIIGRPIARLWPLGLWPGVEPEYTNASH
ncbi:MAG: signal peptidase I [Patescibacteria group bacterium]